MKQIIALRGKSNSGKTSSFLVLGKLIYESGMTSITGNFFEKENKKRGRDFVHVFETNSIRIGVASAGDLYAIVREQIDCLANEHGCSIILCTCRSYDKKKPGTVEAIEETKGFTSSFEPKDRVPDLTQFDLANRNTAQALLEKLLLLTKAH